MENDRGERIRKASSWTLHTGQERQAEKAAARAARSKEIADRKPEIDRKIEKRNEEIVRLRSLGVQEGTEVKVHMAAGIAYGAVNSFDNEMGMIWVQLRNPVHEYKKDMRLCSPFDVELEN